MANDNKRNLMTLPDTLKVIWIRILKTVSFLCLIPLLILSFFNHPFYDDYGNAANTIKYGALGVQKFLYNGWTGRYFSSLLLTIANPLSHGWIDGIRLTPLLFMIMILGICYQSLKLMLKNADGYSSPFWCSMAFLLIYIYAMPHVFEGFFWYTGAAVYQVGNVLIVATLIACYKAFAASKNKNYRIAWTIAAILMGGAISATNEVALLQLLGIIGLCFLVSISRRSAAWKFWLMLGLTTFIAAIFAVAAPGNFVRLAAQSDPHAKSLLYSVPRTIFSGIELVSRPQVWTSLLLLLMGWLPFGIKAASVGRLDCIRLHPAIGLACLFLLTCCCYFPFWWIWAAYTPVRTENAIVFFLLAGWLMWIQSTVVWLIRNEILTPTVPTWMSIYIIPVFGIAVLIRGVGVPAWLELGTNAVTYNSHLNRREADISFQKKSGKQVILLEPLLLKKVYCILTEGQGLSADASKEPNKYMARYFNVTSIQTTVDDGLISKEDK